MWYEEAVFYQIYPLGFCGSPRINDGITVNRIKKVLEWIPHLKKMNISGVYFSPVFDSDAHGYDTRDYSRIDPRLGTNEDFGRVVKNLHANGIRVIIDGVFNHVGRGFFGFQDLLKNGEKSIYKDWFFTDFTRNTEYNDGFWYEGWEGYYNLVKLNLKNPEVISYLCDRVTDWVHEFDIDGLRLDVAYCLDRHFMQVLRSLTDRLKDDFFLVGEMLHGDYNTIVNEEMLHSATNYECYKGLYSSFNSMNMFEIAYSINRQFGNDDWALYRGKHMLTFVDNHDVNRIASTLTNPYHLPLIYGLAFAMPGIPCIYYGSEWGAKGIKENGNDQPLRESYTEPVYNGISEQISVMAKVHETSKALCYGSYQMKQLTNGQYIFERAVSDEHMIIAINAQDSVFHVSFDPACENATDLLTGITYTAQQMHTLAPYSVYYWKCEA